MYDGYLRDSKGRHLCHVVEDTTKVLLVWEDLLSPVSIGTLCIEELQLHWPGVVEPHHPIPLSGKHQLRSSLGPRGARTDIDAW